MISTPDRRRIITLINEAVEAGARLIKACDVLNLSIRTIQRWRRRDGSVREDARPTAKRPAPETKLSELERMRILDTINQPEFANLPPATIVPILADRKLFIGSESTMYRVMKETKQLNHRGKARRPIRKRPQGLTAYAPNEILCWDITWMPAAAKGHYFYLYMITDIYYRKIVDWEVHFAESAWLGADVIEKAALRERLHGKPLVLHSDNGSPMRSNTLLTKLYELGIALSNSRPRVSDDNAYIESLFKTLKYTPKFPSGGFKCIETCREWTNRFVQFYNFEHRHKGITYVTPAQRHEGLDVEILKGRAEVYEAARQENPNRWPNNVRQWKHKKSVTLNGQKEPNIKTIAA